MTIQALASPAVGMHWQPASPEHRMPPQTAGAPPTNAATERADTGLPPPCGTVSLQQAQEALQRVLAQSGLPFAADDLLQQPAAAIVAAVTMTLSANQLKLAQMGVEAQKKGSDLIAELRLRQCDDLRQQVDKGLEDLKKAQKSAMIGVVFDWAIAALRVAVAAAKLACGNLPGGIAELAAAGASIVKAAAATALLADPDNQTARQVHEMACYAEFALDLVCIATDVVTGGLKRLMTSVPNKVKDSAVGIGGGASQLAAGVTGRDRAGLQLDIDTLAAGMMLRTAQMDALRAESARIGESARNDLERAGRTQQSGLKNLNMLGLTQAMIVNAV